MNKETSDNLFTLKEAIKMDSRFIDLNCLEEEVLSNENVKKVSLELKALKDSYSELISKFGLENNEAKKLKDQINKTKIKLDSLNEMKNYNSAFVKANDLLREIELIIFNDFKENSLCKECHD